MAKSGSKGTIIIAGPGAGKTHNMVAKIIAALPLLSGCRYLAVITYTNSATNNILGRLSKKIVIPQNLFIGTIHSFLNRFIVVPFSSFNPEPVGQEKIFMQCGIDDVFSHVEKSKPADKRSKTPEAISKAKAGIKKRLNTLGYITFDQTLSIAAECMSNAEIARIVANRLQYLFVDEFQDSGNAVFNIIEAIRKQSKTTIYCVGDPEQYIQSFDSSIRSFSNIPILKAAGSSGYQVEINNCNYRSSKNIADFLNNFNGRQFGGERFSQIALSKENSEPKIASEELIYFIAGDNTVTPIVNVFYNLCEQCGVELPDRCIIAKKKDVISRIVAAVGNHYKDPKKSTSILPIRAIQDTLLTTLQLDTSKFCSQYNSDVNTLRKHSIAILKAINSGTIKDENTFGNFVQDVLGLKIKAGLPVKIENLRFDIRHEQIGNAVTVATIHTIKGLEAPAVLAIAKNEEELLLWIEASQSERDKKRTNETTDYPRLGYVAFSRAEKLLCIACLQPVSTGTLKKLEDLKVFIHSNLLTVDK
jgi:DNA helicase-2/ATP-dependent DNA helicase PcrA